MHVLTVLPQYEDSIQEVENVIQKTINSNARIMDTITYYILRSSGKRLRPALFLASLGLDRVTPGIINTAASIELIHTASLVHDDIVDQSLMRRGLPTVNARWGNEISVLTGDYLFARAFVLLTKSGCHEIISILAEVIEGMSVGEIEQLMDVFNPSLSEEAYLERIKKKTAYFMAGACMAGGLLRKGGEEELKALYNYGLNLGLAFQIKDDILDFQGQEEVTGKPRASDLRQGIITLPVIHLLRHGKSREELKENIRNRQLSEACLTGVLKEMQQAGSLAYCEDLVKAYTTRAIKALEDLGDAGIKRDLNRITEANASRCY